MEWMDKLEMAAMVVAEAGALAPVLLTQLTLYKADREELAVEAAEVELIYQVRRLRQVAILLVEAAEVGVDPQMASMPRVDLIQEISVEDLGALAIVVSDQALEAGVEAVEAVLEVLSL